MTAPNAQPGYLSQVQIAPDNGSLAPGTYVALSETAKFSMTPKYSPVDISVFQADSDGMAETVQDVDFALDAMLYDKADGGEKLILQSVFPSSIGGAFLPQQRLWAQGIDFSAAGVGKSIQGSFFVSEIGVDCSDAAQMSKLTTKFAFDGSPGAASGAVETGVAILAPSAPLAPTAAYKAIVSVNTIGGTSVAFTGGEALSQIGTTNSYQLPTGKRALDITTPLVIHSGTAVPTGAYTVDGLFGIVNFGANSPGTNAVTISGTATKYWTMNQLTNVPKASMTFSPKNDTITALNQVGKVFRAPTGRAGKASLTVIGLAQDLFLGGGNVQTESFFAIWNARAAFLLEIDPDGTQTAVFRAWVILDSPAEAPERDKITMQTLGMTFANQALRGSVANGGSTLVYGGASWGAP